MVIALLGFLLGLMTLRVAGHYFALATLAVTAIVQLALIHWEALTGGAAGMPVPPFEIMGRALTNGRELYYVILPVTALFILITHNLTASRFGRALTADPAERNRGGGDGTGRACATRPPRLPRAPFSALSPAVCWRR